MADAKGGKGAPAKGGKAPSKQTAKDSKAVPTEKLGRGAPTYAVASADSLAAPEGYRPRLRSHYEDVVRQKMIEEFGYKNPFDNQRAPPSVGPYRRGDPSGFVLLIENVFFD